MIYNTWARSDNQWVRKMLDDWRASGKPFLSFPWVNYQLLTLPTGVFWLYMFYSAVRTDIEALQGKIEFRLQVVAWHGEDRFLGQDVFRVREKEDATVWFMVDRFEELRREDGALLSLRDFQHAHGQHLVTMLRLGIPNVLLAAPVQIIQRYP
jgi:hypothetical protein